MPWPHFFSDARGQRERERERENGIIRWLENNGSRDLK